MDESFSSIFFDPSFMSNEFLKLASLKFYK